MSRRKFLKSIGAVGSISLFTGCSSRLNEHVFEETNTFEINPGLHSFTLDLNKDEPIKLSGDITGDVIFLLVSPWNNVVLTNIYHSTDSDLGVSSTSRDYTIENLERSGEYQLIIGDTGEIRRSEDGIISVSRSSYPRLTDATWRRSTNPEGLITRTWGQSDQLWEVDQLRDNNWESIEAVINNRGKLTQYLTPHEAQNSIKLNQALVIEELIETIDYEIDYNHKQILEYLLLTQKIYAILDHMRNSLQGIIDGIVNILLEALTIKFGGAYQIIEDPLKNSIRDVILNQLSLDMGPITSETNNEVSYILFLTGTSSFTMRNPSSGQQITDPLPEVEITAKLEVHADIDSYFPYEISPNIVDTYRDIELVETGD